MCFILVSLQIDILVILDWVLGALWINAIAIFAICTK